MKGIFTRRSPIQIGIMLFALLILSSITFTVGQDTAQAAATGGRTFPTYARTADPTALLGNGLDLGRQVLPPNDGWASADGGTTGGSAATPDHVYTVTNREQLVQALGGDNTGADATPKIIYIKGVINGNEDDQGNPLTCDDYITDGYSLAAYLAAYDPSVWGRSTKPSGPLEDARHASENNQGKQVKIYIPSNTTIVGLGGARVLGANFMVSNVNNVIIRNIQFENAFDCFPQWDPTDGATGNWNSAFDNISILNNATHVWIDHDSFTDGNLLDSQEPQYFGREYEQHDGELDITKGADYVTVSWNRFTNHDKTMLIGSTDSPTYDVGKLHITLHHNDFVNTIQRLPRVRYGQVHVYNDLYEESSNSAFLYALGVGVSSQIYAQNNYYILPSGFSAGNIIGYYGGTAIHTEGDIVNGVPTDILAAYNTANPSNPLSGSVDWTPQYHLAIDPTQLVPDIVRLFAGASATITVSQNGRGDFSSVQAAIDSIPANNAMNTTILLQPGTYQEVINVPANKPYITMIGDTLNPRDTVIAYNNWSGTPAPGGGTLGTSGSATATFNANDFAAFNITFANTFDPASQPQTNQHQAVAVKTVGDRLIFGNDRFLSNQDTLYANSPSTTSVSRQLYINSYIEGNVDFIFGRGTAVFDHDTIFIKEKTGGGQTMTAASTPAAQQYGFLFTHCVVESEAPAGSVFLGRPWPATPDAQAQVTIRDTWLPAAISQAPWENWSSPPVSWQSARFAEYHNSGPGAGVNANRPQLTPAQAAQQTPYSYLVGQDNWTPDGWF
ncbi:MAG TPA: pectinesterase family protein [Ktedonobacteraceae bacterium]|nr:pectinesterase family protein [Ktedonobacteraceae bacterium]